MKALSLTCRIAKNDRMTVSNFGENNQVAIEIFTMKNENVGRCVILSREQCYKLIDRLDRLVQR